MTTPIPPVIPQDDVTADALRQTLLRRLEECQVTEGVESWFQVRPDVFCIPCDGAYLLYAPLQNLLFAIDCRSFAALLTAGDGCCAPPSADPLAVEAGSVLTLLDTVPKQYPKTVQAGEPFSPSRVMLSLTSRCQFACRYCYIRGGERAKDLPWPLAEAALRFGLDARRDASTRPFTVEFHGEGEPALNWSVLERAVRFVEVEAGARGLQPEFQLGTNGMLSADQVAFLAEHRMQVTLSMDGLRAAMDAQRPMRGGGSSFDAVTRTIQLLDAHRVAYSIRCTVGDGNRDELPEWIRFLGTQTGCRMVAIEPVADVGRADGAGPVAADVSDFVALLKLAREEGIRHGITVHSAELQLAGPRRSFCSGCGSALNFCVSTEGIVSSCYGVLDGQDPRAEIFCYGHYDPQAGAFHLDEQRIARLQSLAPADKGRCRTCFARWSCAGGCLSMRSPARAAAGFADPRPEFCRAVRTMTADDLMRTCVVMGMVPGR